MAPTVPLAFATLAAPLPPPKPYITGIIPTSLSNHLVLQHPENDISIADAQSLQVVDRLTGIHTAPVTQILCDNGSIWSSSMDATIVRWDERSRSPATSLKAFIRKPLPVLAMAVCESDNLVIGGTELISSEAHILYWDIRNPKEPAYRHSSTHSNDITSLSLLPPTAEWQASPGERRLPGRLLLSTSTDGCIALSDIRETDEEDAVEAEHTFDQASIANARAYMWKGQMKVWARTDMNAVGTWNVGCGDEGDLEFRDFVESPSKQFMNRTFETPQVGPNVVHAPMEEKPYPSRLKTEYLIDVCPTLGISKNGAPMVGAGTNDGDIVLLHESIKKDAGYMPSAYFVSGPVQRGHKDVVRCMYHAVRDEALYTGSEDGVLAGWSLASIPRLQTGDPEVDDDGGDGREDIDSEDEESEIETEESDETSEISDRSDGSDMEMDLDGREPKVTPVYGGKEKVSRREERKRKRHAPY